MLVLLASPRWEKGFLHFLELSGVGRIIENEKGEEEVWAEKKDGWIIWENEEGMIREPN
jgi:hypothetical protein